MLPAELIGRLRLTAESHRAPGLAERVSEAAPVAPVRAIEAEVEALLPDGRYRVRAGERRFETELPAGTRAGERVRIAAAAPAGGSAEDPATVAARLSATGRLLSRLTEGLGAGRGEGAAPASEPLLLDSPADVARTAATLRELAALSGWIQDTPSRVITWSGPIWPGQPMYWEIEEEAREGGGAGDGAANAGWSTRVALELPRLGPVEARIALGAAGLAVRFAAHSPATGALLDRRSGELATALARAGLRLASIEGSSHARP